MRWDRRKGGESGDDGPGESIRSSDISEESISGTKCEMCSGEDRDTESGSGKGSAGGKVSDLPILKVGLGFNNGLWLAPLPKFEVVGALVGK